MEYNGKQLRHEHKYIINYHEYSYLKPRIAAIMRLDSHAGDDGYHLRSLYFDDMYNSAYSEKESGVEFREKYRIRIYNKSDSVIKLERKDKYADFIAKSSVSLTREQYEKIMAGDVTFLAESDSQLMHDMFYKIRTVRLAPAVIVDYHRDVFVYDEGNVRITFDSVIEAGTNTTDIFSPNITTAPAIENGLMVLEVKYDDYLPDVIKKALQITAHRREAFSKYVYCRQAMMKYNPASATVIR